jgi:hypothetical protein
MYSKRLLPLRGGLCCFKKITAMKKLMKTYYSQDAAGVFAFIYTMICLAFITLLLVYG